MTILIDYDTDKELNIPYEALAQEVAVHITESENCPYDVSVNLVITDNEEIKKINQQFRSIGAPTDVLSFPMIPFETPADYSIVKDKDEFFDLDTDELILGDVMISVEKVYAQAEGSWAPCRTGVQLSLLHSMLHLLGYDHMEPEEAAVMEAKQAKSIGRIGNHQITGSRKTMNYREQLKDEERIVDDRSSVLPLMHR